MIRVFGSLQKIGSHENKSIKIYEKTKAELNIC